MMLSASKSLSEGHSRIATFDRSIVSTGRLFSATSIRLSSTPFLQTTSQSTRVSSANKSLIEVSSPRTMLLERTSYVIVSTMYSESIKLSSTPVVQPSSQSTKALSISESLSDLASTSVVFLDASSFVSTGMASPTHTTLESSRTVSPADTSTVTSTSASLVSSITFYSSSSDSTTSKTVSSVYTTVVSRMSKNIVTSTSRSLSSVTVISSIQPSPTTFSVFYQITSSAAESSQFSSRLSTSITSLEPSPTSSTYLSSSVSFPNIDSNEGLVVVSLFVPLNEKVNTQEFKDNLARNLLEAFRLGLARSNQRKRRDTKDESQAQSPSARITARGLEHPRKQIINVMESYLVDLKSRRKRQLQQRRNRAAALNNLMRDFLGSLEKNRAPRKERFVEAFGVPGRVYRRIRRATDNYRVQITSIKRTPNNQSEKVDVKYRVLDDNNIVPASEVADKTNLLSDNELMFALKIPVVGRPEPLSMESTPKPSTGDDKSLTIAAIVVPVAVALLLLVLYLYIKCVARKRKKVRQKPKQKSKTEAPAKEMQEPRPGPSPSKPKDLYQAQPSLKRSSGSTDEERYPHRPLPVLPHVEPTIQVVQPKQRHLRREGSKHRTMKGRKKEKHAKRSMENDVEMKPLAGVIENAPRLGQNLLPKEEPKEKLPVRFSALPPLVQTPLVSGTPKQAFEEKDEKVELAPGKKTAEAALPQANVERMRNKIRQREKHRQDLREKERIKEEKLIQEKGGETEGVKKTLDSDDASVAPSYDAMRKKKMRRDRWIHNRVGMSTSLESNSETSSEADSEMKRREEEEKLKQELEKIKNKKKRKKAKKDTRPVGVSGVAPKAEAHDALRESNWVTDETPGVQLVNVRPRDPDEEYQSRPANAVPLFPQQPIKQQFIYPQPAPSQYVQDLLHSGYPTIPPLSEPADVHYLASPRESVLISVDEEERDLNGNLYQSLGPDPHVPRSDSMVFEDELSPRSNLYEQQLFTPASLPQSQLVRPIPIPTQKAYPRTAFPNDILRQQPQASTPIAVTRGRPSSARPTPQGGRGTRPSSARATPSPSHIYRDPRQYVQDRPWREAQPVDYVSPRSYTRPPSVASTQPSLGTSPKYMSTPRSSRDQRDPYQEARTMLDSARKQVDRFEREKLRDDPEGVSNGHPKPRPAGIKLSRVSQPRTPDKQAHDKLAAMEKAELEAQMLVSRALARARSNVKS